MGQTTTSHFKTGISGMNRWSSLAHRRLIRIDGPEGRDFLNGLTTQNMHSSSVVFAALLTPQGRFHSDFFVWNHPQRPDSVLLDCHMDHWASIVDVLTLFHGLHDVVIVPDCTDYAVCAGTGMTDDALLDRGWMQGQGAIQVDPRTPAMGVRALVPGRFMSDMPNMVCAPGTDDHYDDFCRGLGMPQGHCDLVVNQSIILEYGYHHCHALCWDKGCYRGQELMARTHHRGQVRKHMYRLTKTHGVWPAVGTDLYCGTQRVGTMASARGDTGLASLHTERVFGAPAMGEPDHTAPVVLGYTNATEQDKHHTVTVRCVLCFDGDKQAGALSA
jgi:folate-binding protein YgfZ